MLLYLTPQKAVVGDMDETVIGAFKDVRGNVNFVQDALKGLLHEQDQRTLHTILCRDIVHLKGPMKTASFIYLSKKSFGSCLLRRKDNQGYVIKFRGEDIKIDDENLQRVSQYLQTASVKFHVGDFRETLKSARRGDFVFLDPPYTSVRDEKSQYYKADGLSAQDLIDTMTLLDRRGCHVMLVNSNDPAFNVLRPAFECHQLKARESLWAIQARGAQKSRARHECIWVNYPTNKSP